MTSNIKTLQGLFQNVLWCLVIIFSLSGFACFQLNAQSSVKDSLKEVIVKEGTSIKSLWASNQLADEYISSNPDSALLLINNIYPLVEKSKDSSLLIDVIFTKGKIYAERKQLDSAIIIFETARKLAIQTHDKLNLSHINDQIGMCLHFNNESRKGVDYLVQSLEYAVEAGDNEAEHKAANNLGRIYTSLALFDSADYSLNRALDIQIELGDLEKQARILTNLGENAGYAGDFDKYIQYNESAHALFSQLNNVPNMALTLRNIGVTYYFQGDYPNTVDYFQKSLDLLEGTTHYDQWMITLDFFSEVYITTGDFDNALRFCLHILPKRFRICLPLVKNTALWIFVECRESEEIESSQSDFTQLDGIGEEQDAKES